MVDEREYLFLLAGTAGCELDVMALGSAALLTFEFVEVVRAVLGERQG